MTKKTKIFAYYLPQFHTIPENDSVWGEGFTEWTNVKKAKKLFKEHYQPRLPLEKNFYTLTDKNKIYWQMDLAKNHGVDGFAIYHYWYNGKKLLEKPLEIIRDNSELDLPIMIIWE
ncbi:MAG: glycoside hydrolase family 99-like domain-containing protein [Leuconostoc mesenteroides]